MAQKHHFNYHQQYDDDVFLVKKNKKFGLVDKNNDPITSVIYDDILPPENGLFRAILNDEWYILNQQGKVMIGWADYEAKYFLRGVAQIIIDEKIGFMDKAGDIMIEPQFDYASYFDEETNLADVEKDGKEFKINRQGKQVGKTEQALHWTDIFLT